MNCSNVSVACQILAMSKIIMNEAINYVGGFDSKEKMPLYTDTDSIIVYED